MAEAIIPFTANVPVVGMVPGLRRDGPFLVRDFGPRVAGVRRILALQFGGSGDFVIALPALRSLRAAFPNAVIRAYVECSPCGYEAIEDCPNDHICMKLITPDDVLRYVDECLAVALAPASIKETAP